VRESRLAVSLGTSDTVFGLMREPRVDTTGTGHVFGAPTGDFMGLTCFKNGRSHASGARREATWPVLGSSRHAGRQPRPILLPWYDRNHAAGGAARHPALRLERRPRRHVRVIERR
jgi:hypothetical protein